METNIEAWREILSAVVMGIVTAWIIIVYCDNDL